MVEMGEMRGASGRRMIRIISGTDREGSSSLVIAKEIQKVYHEMHVDTEILDLRNWKPLISQLPDYGDEKVQNLTPFFNQVLNSTGLVVVAPEYNGSMPGILKLFIDYMKFPESFEFRPVCFVGIGGRFAGLRPVEHLQQVFGYRNAFIYPERVFLSQVWTLIEGGSLKDLKSKESLKSQAKGFFKFTCSLENFHRKKHEG